jgi:broad specificity phosphatase PhoE
MIIYFVRHGKTELCKKGYVKGWADSNLTLEGERSAEKLGLLLEDKGIEIIYTSDLGRCVETSKIINKFLKLEIVESKELRERNFGLFNGKPKEEIEKNFNLDDVETIAPEGESFNQAKERAMKFINSLKDKKEKVILVVTHDGILRGIIGGDTSDELFYKLNF